MALSGSWPKCPPSSASCCLRAASTFGLRQPSGSRRRSRGGHYGHDPSTSHVIMSQSLHSTIIRVRSDFLSASCRASLLAEGYPAERHLIPHRTPFPPGMHRPQIYKLGNWIGIQSPIFWIAKCLDGEVWPVTK